MAEAPLLDFRGIDEVDDVQEAKSNPFSSPIIYWSVITFLVVITVADVCIGIVMFDKFDTPYAQYLNQATAFVYCIATTSILLGRYLIRILARDRRVTTEKVERPTPEWYKLIAIGLFNGSGNFCMAIAQPHTPGLTQSLLFLLGIPLVLLISFLFLRKKPSLIAIGGAAIIVVR